MTSLGVIGGLGPMASAYFMELLTKMTKADADQEHLDVILFSRPAVPDRTAFILGKSQESPVPPLMATARQLEQLGVSHIVIPCITSHGFYDEISAAVHIPIIHIVRETARYLKAHGIHKAGIMATSGTIATRLFQTALEAEGIAWQVPSAAGQEKVMTLIYQQVKAGLPADMALFSAVSDELRAGGCESVILGCTELSLIKKDNPIGSGYLDAMEVLAVSGILACGGVLRPAYENLLK